MPPSGVGAAAYFGLTFTPIEALRHRARLSDASPCCWSSASSAGASEARLEKAIEDLSRLLSTDAQAGNVLSQRVNALADQNAGKRLEGLEADLSVLGTAVRQVAEAVAELEESSRGRDPDQPRERPSPSTTTPSPSP